MRVVFQDDGLSSASSKATTNSRNSTGRATERSTTTSSDWTGYLKRRRYPEPVQGFQAGRRAHALLPLFIRGTQGSIFNRLGYSFEYETIPKNIDYYIKRTSHGSTLSRVVHSWVLARSDRVRSWNLFTEALESDISDTQGGTTPEGIHLGAMAGMHQHDPGQVTPESRPGARAVVQPVSSR
jgi:hypothetical protein